MPKLPKNKQNGVFAMSCRRARVAALYLSGKSQQAIAADVGVSQMSVSTDLAFIREAWLASSLRDFDAMKAEELARLELLEREAWEAWHLSKEDEETTRTQTLLAAQRGCPAESGEGKAALIPVAVVEETTTCGRTGDPRYLLQVFRCVETRLKMMGLLDGPPAQVNNVVLNWDAVAGVSDGVGPGERRSGGGSATSFPDEREGW